VRLFAGTTSNNLFGGSSAVGGGLFGTAKTTAPMFGTNTLKPSLSAGIWSVYYSTLNSWLSLQRIQGFSPSLLRKILKKSDPFQLALLYIFVVRNKQGPFCRPRPNWVVCLLKLISS